MREFVLDASFALGWCFEDEATAETEALLTALQDQQAVAWVPGIWRFEMLNGLGKGVTRQRLNRNKAFLLWQEIQALPIRVSEVPADEKLLELALLHNLAVYDASYLSLSQVRALAVATAGDWALVVPVAALSHPVCLPPPIDLQPFVRRPSGTVRFFAIKFSCQCPGSMNDAAATLGTSAAFLEFACKRAFGMRGFATLAVTTIECERHVLLTARYMPLHANCRDSI